MGGDKTPSFKTLNTEFPNLELQAQLPPMLRSYCEYKHNYQDALILIQVGDFYEAFFNDAVVLSKVLNLTLTSRDKNSDNPIPMAGIPQGVVDNYVNRLLENGLSVAIVTQEGSGKSVTRFLDRVVTPGVNLAATYQDSEETNLLSIYFEESDLPENNFISIAYSNLISGTIYQEDFTDWISAQKKIFWIDPKEIVLPRVINDKTIDQKKTWVRDLFRKFEHIKFRNLRNTRNCSDINGFISASTSARKAIQLLVSYVDEVTVEKNVPFQSVLSNQKKNCLIIDSRTRANLELIKNQKDGSVNGTLLKWLDQTQTPGGKRLLKNWIISPLFESNEINNRYDYVSKLIPNSEKIHKTLNGFCDLEKICTRIDLDYASPIELVALRDSLNIIPSLNSAAETSFDLCEDILTLINKYILRAPANSIKFGGVIKSEIDPELTKLRNLKTTGSEWVIDYEAQEKTSTGINNLKVKYTEIHGYFIEIVKNQLSKVPVTYIKKQSTLNADKYTTIELKSFESDILTAESKAIEIEKKYYLELLQELKKFTARIKEVSAEISNLDVLNSFAIKSLKNGLVRPEIVENGLNIVKGKHPILLDRLGMDLIPNGLNLDQQMVVLLVGPNMGGKSTFLRQTALLIILAQIGCFVPADKMSFSLVDQLFARIGATDDIHEGDSTFMVEMREASFILVNSTGNSLVLIDELGRGTATKDGMSIAQAVLEDLITRKIRTVFATHYHELTELDFNVLQNLSVGCEEQDGDIIFNHCIVPGVSNRSYGYEVAKLAGVPEKIIFRAKSIANQFQTQKGEQLTFNFESAPTKEYDFIKEVRKTSLDQMTPLAALNLLYKIKNEINS